MPAGPARQATPWVVTTFPLRKGWLGYHWRVGGEGGGRGPDEALALLQRVHLRRLAFYSCIGRNVQIKKKRGGRRSKGEAIGGASGAAHSVCLNSVFGQSSPVTAHRVPTECTALGWAVQSSATSQHQCNHVVHAASCRGVFCPRNLLLTRDHLSHCPGVIVSLVCTAFTWIWVYFAGSSPSGLGEADQG